MPLHAFIFTKIHSNVDSLVKNSKLQHQTQITKRTPLLTIKLCSFRQKHITVSKSICALALLVILTTVSIRSALAGPWVEPSNERTRHHLQNLVDSGVSETLVTSWPIMWSNINSELKTIDASKLNENTLWSYKYLKHELKRAQRQVLVEQNNNISNSTPAIRDFSSDSRYEQEASLKINITGNNSTLQLNTSYIKNGDDEKRVIHDGSHLSYLLKNWMIGVGKVDRWWGPGWESSLILSHNARPAPSVFIQRNFSEPFETPLLRWLGPWQMTTFMSQLESNRSTPDARIWGMRINLRPLKSLEIGLSRTAMWGGEGRPGDAKTLFNMLVGRDNQGTISDGNEDTSDEPGNQLAGVDWRWGHKIGPLNTAIYGQLIGEDEAGGLPSRHIGLAGIEFNGLFFNTQSRLSIEGKNTTVYFYDTEKNAPNVAYEHPLYRSGYRYRGDPIGASTDNDSESITLRTQLFMDNGHSANISMSKHNINMDGTSVSAPGGSVYGSEQFKTLQTQISYSAPLSKHLLIEAGLFAFSNDLKVKEQNINNGLFVQINTRW
jgi:hypothetical protein